MTEKTTYQVLIRRQQVGILQDYFHMKNINNYTTIRNDHDELKPFEEIYKRKITKLDVLVVSPLTKAEITEIIDNYYTNEELWTFQEIQSREELKEYYEFYGGKA